MSVEARREMMTPSQVQVRKSAKFAPDSLDIQIRPPCLAIENGVENITFIIDHRYRKRVLPRRVTLKLILAPILTSQLHGLRSNEQAQRR